MSDRATRKRLAGDAVADLKRLCHSVPLAARDVARATRVSDTTARAWLRGAHAPTGARIDRVAELVSVMERLRIAMKPEAIAAWLTRPVPELGGACPADLLASGERERLADLVDRLVHATFT